MPDQNARVNELPLGTPKIGDWFLFYDETNDITKRCSVDPFIASDSNDIEWVEGEDYDTAEIVTYGGNIYQSEVDNNTAVPGTPGSNWTLKTAGVSGLVFWAASSVYLQEEVFVLGLIADDVTLFRLDPDIPRPYTSGTTFATDVAAGDWIPVGKAMAGTYTLTAAILIQSASGQHVVFDGPANFIVDRDGNRNLLLSMNPETGAFGDGGFELSVVDPGTGKGTFIKFDDLFLRISNDRGAVDFPGIEYDIDYSANFTNRSLVDKAYVDAILGAFWALIGTSTLTGNVTIDGDGFSINHNGQSSFEVSSASFNTFVAVSIVQIRQVDTGLIADLTLSNGDADLSTTGTISLSPDGGLRMKSGSNKIVGVATLVGGTITVNNTLVTTNSIIMLTVQSLGTVASPKAIAVTARVASTSFTITSADVTDTSVVGWQIIEPF